MTEWNMGAAVLPQAAWLPLWVKLSWAIVVSATVLRVSGGIRQAPWLAALVGVALLLPRVDVLSGYLALVFQTPSLVLVAWGLWCWGDVWLQRKPVSTTPWGVALLGVLLGWALVVDTLNYWPVWFNPQLYALGFEASGLWLVLALTAGGLWVCDVPQRWMWSAWAVLLVYAVLRLPTGNVWDALLDPFVWLALHVQLWRTWRASRS